MTTTTHSTADILKAYFIYFVLALAGDVIPFLRPAGTLLNILAVLVLSGQIMWHSANEKWSISMGLFFIPFIFFFNNLFLVRGTVSSIVSILIKALVMFLFFVTPYSLEATKEQIFRFLQLFSMVVFIACIYNLLINYRYFPLITNLNSAYSLNISSFFDNKNTFGVYLNTGIISSILLYYFQPAKRYLFLIGLIFINILLSQSKTSLITSTVFIVLSILIGLRGQPKKAILVAAAISMLIMAMLQIDFFTTYFNNALLTGTKSYAGREVMLEQALQKMTGLRKFFGYGDTNVSSVLLDAVGNPYFHNGFLYVYFSGGLLKLCFYVFMIGVGTKRILKIHTQDKNLSLLFLAALLTFVLYAFSEGIALFDTILSSYAFTMLTMVIPIMYSNSLTKPSVPSFSSNRKQTVFNQSIDKAGI